MEKRLKRIFTKAAPVLYPLFTVNVRTLYIARFSVKPKNVFSTKKLRTVSSKVEAACAVVIDNINIDAEAR